MSGRARESERASKREFKYSLCAYKPQYTMSVKRWHTTHRILGGKYNVIVVYPARDINSARQMGMRRLEREPPTRHTPRTSNSNSNSNQTNV